MANFVLLPSMVRVFTLKSTPMVAESCGSNKSSVNLSKMEDFPTPLSPIINIFSVKKNSFLLRKKHGTNLEPKFNKNKILYGHKYTSLTDNKITV
ncbi:hypothetical protein BpHYR1_051399 [Brachionus plicatilis]|uniref:Uncharacterized protein n=1 Tax=Brachionus plicatilis TaxID=10195 RepID=A0A3M7S2L9_BRAPC|nr:hypothetical protein BpHYR1_051399 [Brachionus plicatilis]